MSTGLKLLAQGGSKRWSVEDARVILARWERSGLSVQSFAAREGLSATRLYRWQSRLADARAVGFIEIAKPQLSAPKIEVVLASGTTVRIPDSADVEFAARLIAALEQRSC